MNPDPDATKYSHGAQETTVLHAQSQEDVYITPDIVHHSRTANAISNCDQSFPTVALCFRAENQKRATRQDILYINCASSSVTSRFDRDSLETTSTGHGHDVPGQKDAGDCSRPRTTRQV